jgi:hypothetical protein
MPMSGSPASSSRRSPADDVGAGKRRTQKGARVRPRPAHPRTPTMPPKTSNPPPSAFSEPSEGGPLAPQDKPAELINGNQEENPQATVSADSGKKKAKDEHEGKPKSKL